MSEPRSLKDAFNELNPALQTNSVLRTYNGVAYLYYDFAQHVTMTSMHGGYTTVTPFAQLDRDVLIAARDKLVELGGKPPELPGEAPSNPVLARKAGGLNP